MTATPVPPADDEQRPADSPVPPLPGESASGDAAAAPVTPSPVPPLPGESVSGDAAAAPATPAAPAPIPPAPVAPGAAAPTPPGYAAPAPVAPGGYPAPGYAPPAPGGYPGTGYAAPAPGGYPAPGYAATPQWQPAPKPGLIPLRPLSFGTLLSAPFLTLRRNPSTTFGSALLVQGLLTVVTFGVIWFVTFGALDRIETASAQDLSTVQAGSIAMIIISALIPLLLQFACTAFLQGVMIIEVSRSVLGEKRKLGEVWKRVWPRLWPLIAFSLVTFLALLVVVLVATMLVFAIWMASGESVLTTVLLGILIGLGFLVLCVWVYTKVSLAPSVIVLERRGVFAALRRSWALTRGAFWRVFGVQFIINAIVSIVSQVITMPISFAAGILIAILDPTGSLDDPMGSSTMLLYLVTGIISLFVGAITAVVMSAAMALLYIDRRIRTEGLDVVLIGYTEAAWAGRTDLEDPYTVTLPDRERL